VEELQTNISGAPDDSLQKKQFKFEGAWLPDYDPAEIGPSNYKTLQNMRYGPRHPVGVLGYTKVNTTALTTYTNIRNGHQLRTDWDKPSYVFVHAQNGSGQGRVYQNQTVIPDQGNFESTHLHTDMTGAGIGRFSDAPDGNVTYCNGKESYIWSGEETRVGGFITITDANYTNPINYTEQANNTLDTTDNIISIGTQKFWIVFTTRPIQAVNYTIKTVNTSTSTSTVKVWNGSSWAAVSNPVDGTADGGVSLAQSGQFSFDSTVATAKPFHLEGLYLFAYMFELSAGSAEISHVSVNAPWQPMIDVWDGVLRQPIQFQVYDGSKFRDYTLEVNEKSNVDYPIGAVLDALPTSGYIIAIYEQRMAGIRYEMLEGKVNTNAATVTIEYWNGTAWTTVGASLRDETLDGTKSVAKTGLMSWSPPDPSAEHKKTQFGVTGFAYKIKFSATLSGTAEGEKDIVANLVTGIPAQLPIRAYRFPSSFKNRVLLCGFVEGKEGNRVDYSAANNAYAFNGLDSSDNGVQSLYFGGTEALTCGIQLYNRYGSNIFTTWVGFKQSSCYQLTGNEPEDFKIKPVSFRIGCPAPLTLVAVEGYSLAQDLTRNVVIWLSHAGPMLFDGASLTHIKGIDKYFDPSESVCINFDAIENSRGWYDTTHGEYNLLIPSGSGQTTNNLWLVYDLTKKKWFTKSTGTAPVPQCGFPVVDTDGNQYIYAGVDTGYLMRLENGTSWDGAGITYRLVTGDFWPTDSIWDKTIIRHLKVIAKRISEPHTLEVSYYGNTDDEEGFEVVWQNTEDFEWTDTEDFEWATPTLLTMDLDIESGLYRLVRDTLGTNLLGWSHCFGFQVTTTSTMKAFQPIGWGIRFQYIRDDL
jgi:hypothetical protein